MRNGLKKLLGQNESPHVIYGYKKYLDEQLPEKRALLSYLVDPVLSKQQRNFSNAGIAVTWPKILNQLGFLVDIIDWDNDSTNLTGKYDLVIMHGGKNTSALVKAAGAEAVLVYFASGCYWQFHNQQEKARFDDFKNRHGVELPPDRAIGASEEEANQLANSIICLGDEHTKSTFSKFKNVYNLKIGSYVDIRPKNDNKDVDTGRKNYLFFSGNGNVHKGLDLLLDVFAELPDYNLYICTNLDPAFEDFYSKLLHENPNIHYRGFVPVESEDFYSLTDKCNFVVLPSCSEGSPGSVVDCMRQGLIPLVSKEAGLDTSDFGVTLDKTNRDTLQKAIIQLSQEPTTKLHKRSAATLKASGDYSSKAFETNLRKYVEKTYREARK